MIVICGAGIAGLAMANALEQLGEDYLVLEQSPSVRTEGAGLVLHHNALCVLESLGTAKTLSGIPLTSFQMMMGSQTLILPFTQNGASRALAVHREQVMLALLAKLPEKRIRCNTGVKSLQHGSSTVVHTEQGELKARAVVIANGAASQLHGTARVNSTGQWCWRAIVPGIELGSIGAEHWYGKHRLGIIPVNLHQAYVFHVVEDADDHDIAAHLQWIQLQQTQGRFRNLDFSNAQWLSHPLNERHINWGHKNCVAIGDAAHAMTPNMGQGAAMAMEDAWTLARLIQRSAAAGTLARQMKDTRQKRVRAVQRQSLQIGKIAHWQQRALCSLRNNVFGLLPPVVMARQQQQQMLAFTSHM